jgi:hypothetical protein
MNILDCEQGSAVWFEARLGCVTSSRIDDAISFLKRKSKDKQKGDETAARERMRMELVCELLSGKASDHYVSKWMEEGKEKEPLARTAYELERNVYVEQVGFVFHPTIKLAGASPDGLVGDDGLVEFKCPKLSTHLRYIMNGFVPSEYVPQMFWQMACSGGERKWNDFVSYVSEPKLPKELRTFIAPRLHWNQEIIDIMNSGVEQFNLEVQDMLMKLKPSYIEEKLAASIAYVKAKREAERSL